MTSKWAALTLEQKVEVIRWKVANLKMDERCIAQDLNCSKTQINYIRTSDFITAEYERNTNKARQHVRN